MVKLLMKTKILNIGLLGILACLIGFGGAVGGISWYQKSHQETINDRITNFYDDEMATLVSPANLRNLIDKKDTNYVLVDLRSKDEYDSEHMVTAINIPAVSLTSEQLLAEFKKIPRNKQIIVHCYSSACTLGRQVGQFLAHKGIYVKELDIGWSEWKYFWNLWNPGEDPSVGKTYVIKSNTKPGTPGVCTQGSFGC